MRKILLNVVIIITMFGFLVGGYFNVPMRERYTYVWSSHTRTIDKEVAYQSLFGTGVPKHSDSTRFIEASTYHLDVERYVAQLAIWSIVSVGMFALVINSTSNNNDDKNNTN